MQEISAWSWNLLETTGPLFWGAEWLIICCHCFLFWVGCKLLEYLPLLWWSLGTFGGCQRIDVSLRPPAESGCCPVDGVWSLGTAPSVWSLQWCWCTPSQPRKPTWPSAAVGMAWRRPCSTPKCGAATPKTYWPGWRREYAWVSARRQLEKGNRGVACNSFGTGSRACSPQIRGSGVQVFFCVL